MNSIKLNFMKTTIQMSCTLCAVILLIFGLVGCEGDLDIYSIDSPENLQAEIDSIAAAKAGVDTGDTTYLDISTAIVGAEDNSAAWWTAFSDYFAIPTDKLLHLEFINNGTGINNWNNWNLAIVNAVGDRDGEGYAEYFVLRSDAFGWGAEFDLGLVLNNYPDTDGDEDIWNDFRATMQGAHVTLEIDHSATGNVYVTATAVGTNGTELVMTYNQPVSVSEDIVAFLIADGSHFLMREAYLLPSRVTVVEDVNAATLSVTGAPATVEIGDENFWGDAVATVTYADGSSEQVDSLDLSFNVVPDMATLGEKTVVVAYSKTKQGNYGPAVSTIYSLEVTNSIASIEASDINYYYFGTNDITFAPRGIVVTATYSDGSTAILDNGVVDFTYPATISSSVGTQTIDVSYTGPNNTFTTTSTATLVEGTSQVGANDFSTGFWGAHSADFTVASGSSKTFQFYVYSTNANNWNSPVTILRNVDYATTNVEYGVMRMDNFGWGDGYATATASSDWNWDIFAASISSSYMEITVTNNGDNTADVRYDVTYASGETHFQEYAGVTVDSADLSCALTVDGCYLVFIN
jgi:hypothetical protein